MNAEEMIQKFSKENEDVEQPVKENDLEKALSFVESFITEETTVELPCLKESVILTPITHEEEISLETNRLTLQHFIEKINGIIVNHVKLPTKASKKLKEIFKDKKSFEENILSVDRSILLFALANISFDNFTEFTSECSSCGKTFQTDFSLENTTFSIKNEKILETDLYQFKHVQTFLDDKLIISFGFTTEDKRLDMMNKLSNEKADENISTKNNLLNILDMFVLSIKEIKVIKNNDEIILNEYEKIKDFIHKLPLKIKDKIVTEIDFTELNGFIPNFVLKIPCPYCHNVDDYNFDPEIEFFRKALFISQ